MIQASDNGGLAASSFEQNKGIVRAFAKAINERDWDRLDELIDPNFSRHTHAAPPVNSREELKEYLRSEFEILSDGHKTTEDMVAEADKVAFRHGFRGTQRGKMGSYPPTERAMIADYLAIYRISNGVIAEWRAEWDNLSGLIQLGHYNPQS